jgi:hypothetical protein
LHRCNKNELFENCIFKVINNYTFFSIGPNGEPMLMIQGEEFHSQLLPTFIETALQILRQASMISSHDIPEIIPGRNTLAQSLPPSIQPSPIKQHLLYPGKVFAYTKKLKKRKNDDNENEKNINYRHNGKIMLAIADSGHHRIIICTLQGRVKVILYLKYYKYLIACFSKH